MSTGVLEQKKRNRGEMESENSDSAHPTPHCSLQ